MHTENTTPTSADPYLASTEYFDIDHPVVNETLKRLIRGAQSDVERVRAIYLYVRDIPYDIFQSFRYLAAGERSASAVLEHGIAFCMGKASSFVTLSRAAGVPARVTFQSLDSPNKEFLSPEVRNLWGGKRGRPLSWHSVGQAFLHNRWVTLDATIDAPTATKLGKPYSQDFDGYTDIYTVEGPILAQHGSYADYPPEVAHWYETLAQYVLDAIDSPQRQRSLADDDVVWAGPPVDQVLRHAAN